MMERIKIPERRNYLVRDGKWQIGDVVSELGVYGVAISFVAALCDSYPLIHVLSI